jgi:hypothetical protein
MDMITMKALATALLYCCDNGNGRRSMETLLACLGVDRADVEQVERAKAEVLALRPDIGDCFDGKEGEEADRPVCVLPSRGNPYPPDTIAHHIWESLAHPNGWRNLKFIHACIQPLLAGELKLNPYLLLPELAVVATPWDPGNGGCSLLRSTRNERNEILYRLEFSIPVAVRDLCVEAFGPVPRPDPRVLKPLPKKKVDDGSWRLGVRENQQSQPQQLDHLT